MPNPDAPPKFGPLCNKYLGKEAEKPMPEEQRIFQDRHDIRTGDARLDLVIASLGVAALEYQKHATASLEKFLAAARMAYEVCGVEEVPSGEITAHEPLRGYFAEDAIAASKKKS